VVRRTALRAAVAAVATVALGLTCPAAAAAAPAPAQPAPSELAPITPGVRMLSPISAGTATACTAAFVFTDGTAGYLAYAAHCAGAGESMGLNGCEAETLPIGSEVLVERNDGERVSARLAYSSWATMQERGETEAALCYLNDFALVELDPADVETVDPSVPVFGGPVGIDTDGTEPGEPVYSYQPNNEGGAGKSGTSLGDGEGGLTHRVETSPPGRPGDSGSGYLDGDGEAFGVLSTRFQDGRNTNGVADLASALSYANRYGGLGRVALVPGTAEFAPPASTGDFTLAGSTP
jgi:hypothetical protein